MDSERYEKGLAVMQDIMGREGVETMEALRDIAPDFSKYVVEFFFGDICSRPGLDYKTREIVALSALTALGTAQPQLKAHIASALRVGCTKEEVIEIIMQSVLYSGFPAALNALFAAKEVFTKNDGNEDSKAHCVSDTSIAG